jgi:hypothetical protein
MEGFCFVISVTGLNRPNTGKDDEYKIGYLRKEGALHMARDH